MNVSQFYRYAYIYGQGDCARFFEHSFNLTMNDFSFVGFALRASFNDRPSLSGAYTLENFGISPTTMRAALALLCLPIDQTPKAATRLLVDAIKKRGSMPPVAYRPSILRQFPIVSFENGARLRAPLIDLLPQRITAGIYYDLVAGDAGLRNEAAQRFEQYSTNFLAATMKDFVVDPSNTYPLQGNQVASPDILVQHQGSLALVVECKATKLTYAAQFADDPAVDAKAQYEELAKGIFQIWRYFSHRRRGIAPGGAVSATARGMVLTLDAWFDVRRALEDRIFALAQELANADGAIIPDDRRPVILSSIHDMEYAAQRTNEVEFLAALDATREEKFNGWSLASVVRDTVEAKAEKRYPFEPSEVLPWWKATDALLGR